MMQTKTVGMYKSFVRSGRETYATHYCPGCGHGIIHKLIAEALFDLNLQDRTIIINPIGCGAFGYYYWDCGNIGAAHGRAQAVGTAINRTLRHAVVIAYQGDGDLAAIGFNNTFQAASRGERLAVFFVNNGIYGMTGGQMAPTSLQGMVTMTSPLGRDAQAAGHPLHVCEVLNQLKAPVYIERVSVADTPRIMQTRRAVRKALEIQRDQKGYAFVEIIAPCPTSTGSDALKAARFCAEEMQREFPLGCFRDLSETAAPPPPAPPRLSVQAFFEGDAERASLPPVLDVACPERGMKFAGFGGQGMLKLGICVAEAARIEQRFATWFPTYGPEQRGGSAACSVVISGRPIGSPVVDRPDVLVCMSQPSYERFLGLVKPGGMVLVDDRIMADIQPPDGVRVASLPAVSLASDFGLPQAANTVMLAALVVSGVTSLRRESVLATFDAGFRRKPQLVAQNLALFEEAETWLRRHGWATGQPR